MGKVQPRRIAGYKKPRRDDGKSTKLTITRTGDLPILGCRLLATAMP